RPNAISGEHAGSRGGHRDYGPRGSCLLARYGDAPPQPTARPDRAPLSAHRSEAYLIPIMTDTRLIERWLPIAALGEESVRERRSMTALPPTVAARAAVLASILPADADHRKFMHALGIHGDPVASRR